MSVEYVSGNLLDFPGGTTVIVHGVSLKGVMGAGIAKGIREEYPAAYDAYMKAHAEGELALGRLTVAEVAGGKRVINLCTQEDVGTDKRQLDYEALYIGLLNIHEILRGALSEGRTWKLGIPQWIGCGLAGGNPEIVKTMVESIFRDSEVPCVVVNYSPANKA